MPSAEYMREYRKRTGSRYDRARQRAEIRAARWVRKMHPEVWWRLLEEARREILAEQEAAERAVRHG